MKKIIFMMWFFYFIGSVIEFLRISRERNSLQRNAYNLIFCEIIFWIVHKQNLLISNVTAPLFLDLLQLNLFK